MNSILGIEYLLNLTLNKIANKLVNRTQNEFFLNLLYIYMIFFMISSISFILPHLRLPIQLLQILFLHLAQNLSLVEL